jgi:hypothetical protein
MLETRRNAIEGLETRRLAGPITHQPKTTDPPHTMTKYKLEYIWLDGKRPVPGLRGKTLLKQFEHPPTLAVLPH